MNAHWESGDMGMEIVLRDEERQPCEVWTRVMGYHRPVASFNLGKQGEHRERRFFRESGPLRA
ncbi:MAG: anaerobic ribonucleoside-triphosphate reductase [Acidithiobacillus sp.]|uniref:anaerobic ribonucleoside-triphosphate reductase n=1 Tax=Acidithiobacillus sp. TaxID=1872118 RepID=UPI003CFDEC56